MAERFTLSKGRFEAFSDGVFSIAITLLILEIRVPVAPSGQPLDGVAAQAAGLLHAWPQYLVYFAAFATIGIMWLNHHALFRYVDKITHGMIVSNLLLLAIVSFFPFATDVLSAWHLSPVAVAYYGIVSTCMSVAYTILRLQVVAAEGARSSFTMWNLIGLTIYPIATVIGFFYPIAGVTLYALLALWYMMPANVASAVVRA